MRKVILGFLFLVGCLGASLAMAQKNEGTNEYNSTEMNPIQVSFWLDGDDNLYATPFDQCGKSEGENILLLKWSAQSGEGDKTKEELNQCLTMKQNAIHQGKKVLIYTDYNAFREQRCVISDKPVSYHSGC